MTFEVISIILNALLGGGLLLQFITLRSVKAKAQAEAETARAETETVKVATESSELDNVEKAITIWRNTAEKMSKEADEYRQRYSDLAREVAKLREDVNKQTASINKILKLLDRITHENLEKIVEQIKNEINGKNN